jgi:hypothetical protein
LRDPLKTGKKQSKSFKNMKRSTSPTASNRLLKDSLLPLNKIKLRDFNIREFDPSWALELALNIAKYGLDNPISLDKDFNLLAGLHRLQACLLLCVSKDQREKAFNDIFEMADNEAKRVPSETDLDNFKKIMDLDDDHWEDISEAGKIAVTIKWDVSKDRDPVDAAIREFSENDWRKDNTERDVHRLIEFLENNGYYLPQGGRPPKNEKRENMRPLLEEILKVSARHLRRIINDHNASGDKSQKISSTELAVKSVKKLNKSMVKAKKELDELGDIDGMKDVVDALDSALLVLENFSSDQGV